MTQKWKINKESWLLWVEQSENLINNSDKAVLTKLKEATNLERIKELEKKAETLELAEKFSGKLENEWFIDFDKIKNAFSQIFEIKKMQLYSVESWLLCFAKWDFMTPKDLKKLESNMNRLNNETPYIKIWEDHYLKMWNQIISIKWKQINNDQLTSSIIKMFRWTIILAAQNINDYNFKK